MQIVRPIIYSNFSFERASVAQYYDEDGILTQAAVDELRLGYDPETLEYIGPIIETAATNHVAKSNEFDHASWTLLGLDPDLDVDTLETESPSGFNDATKFTGDLALSSHSIKQTVSTGVGFATVCVLSVFLKAVVPGTAVRLYIGGTSIVFRINVGDYAALGSAGSITVLPNGWFRCEMWASVTTSADIVIQLSGVGSQSVYMYGAQFEAGSVSYLATSYINNSGTGTATRAEDIVASPPAVISSNVPETDNPEYAPATAYDFEDEVMVTDDGVHRNYRSRIAGVGTNTGNYPPDSPTEWLDLGPTNPWRMFTMGTGADVLTTGTDLIDVTVSIDKPVDRVILFNALGHSAIVTVTSGESIVFEEEVDLLSTTIVNDWYEYFFSDRVLSLHDVAFTVPPAYPATVRVQITGVGEVGLGKLVIGKAVTLGAAEFGNTSIGITNYSTKETDGFGNTFVQARRFVNNDSMRLACIPGSEIALRKFLAPLYTVPCAYMTETMGEPILTLGFYKDFNFLFATPAYSYCSVQVEGI
jgi:hypothetical protein